MRRVWKCGPCLNLGMWCWTNAWASMDRRQQGSPCSSEPPTIRWKHVSTARCAPIPFRLPTLWRPTPGHWTQDFWVVWLPSVSWSVSLIFPSISPRLWWWMVGWSTPTPRPCLRRGSLALPGRASLWKRGLLWVSGRWCWKTLATRRACHEPWPCHCPRCPKEAPRSDCEPILRSMWIRFAWSKWDRVRK